jgi:hypothetical protein
MRDLATRWSEGSISALHLSLQARSPLAIISIARRHAHFTSRACRHTLVTTLVTIAHHVALSYNRSTLWIQRFAMAVSDYSREKAEYKRILSAGIFPPESNPARFLDFVCAKYFEGQSTLSEHTIAVEALGRRPDFDPQQDAIVRVEAHRVRKGLAEYYEHAGASHELRLVIPRGSYLPTFVPRGKDLGTAAPSQGAAGSYAGAFFSRARLALFGSLILLFAAGALWRWKGRPIAVKSLPLRSNSPTLPASRPQATVRIMAGSSAADYTDSLGHVWSSDRYFRGGEASTVPYRKIFRTRNPQLFLTSREGRDFRYDIPLPPGSYELRLYFAETEYGEDNSEGGGESSRIFDISANGVPLETAFDPLSDAGGENTADARAFRGIAPASDGQLHLRFYTQWLLKAVASVNGIEVVPVEPGYIVPIRWVAADSGLADASGHYWQPDQFCFGGRIRADNMPVANTTSPELFRSERYGHFSYAVPVPRGTYRATLYFSEHWFGVEGRAGGEPRGQRVFDVYCNGVALLRDFDIAKDAGGPMRALQKVFRGLKPNAQGKLLFTFVPIKDYAALGAIEIDDESANANDQR